MKGRNILIPSLFLLGAAGAWYAYRLKTAVESLTAKITGIALDWTATKGSAFTSIYFAVNVAVNNPNPENLKIDGIYMSVINNGRSVANANYNQPFTIQGRSTTTAKVIVSVPVLNLFKNVQDAYTALVNRTPLIITFLGGVNAPVGTVKINQTFQLFG